MKKSERSSNPQKILSSRGWLPHGSGLEHFINSKFGTKLLVDVREDITRPFNLTWSFCYEHRDMTETQQQHIWEFTHESSSRYLHLLYWKCLGKCRQYYNEPLLHSFLSLHEAWVQATQDEFPIGHPPGLMICNQITNERHQNSKSHMTD